jgi:hypothetical protein
MSGLGLFTMATSSARSADGTENLSSVARKPASIAAMGRRGRTPPGSPAEALRSTALV